MLASNTRRIAQQVIRSLVNNPTRCIEGSISSLYCDVSSTSIALHKVSLPSLGTFASSSNTHMISLRSIFTSNSSLDEDATTDDSENSNQSSPSHQQPIVPQTPEELDHVLNEWGSAMDNGDWNRAWDIFEHSFPVNEPIFPSLEDLIAWDPEAEDRANRRQREQKIQEDIACSRVRHVDPNTGMAHGVGKRKTSIARVWIRQGNGHFMINKRPYDEYFPSFSRRNDLISPFLVTETLGMFDVMAAVQGGGLTGQAQAMRHGISRALQNWDPEMRPMLKNAGLLTRDARIVERKKPGRKKARKSFQWVKR